MHLEVVRIHHLRGNHVGVLDGLLPLDVLHGEVVQRANVEDVEHYRRVKEGLGVHVGFAFPLEDLYK